MCLQQMVYSPISRNFKCFESSETHPYLADEEVECPFPLWSKTEGKTVRFKPKPGSGLRLTAKYMTIGVMELKKETVYSKSDIGKSALALSLTANWLRKEARVTSTIRLLFVIGNAATAHLYVVLLKGGKGAIPEVRLVKSLFWGTKGPDSVEITSMLAYLLGQVTLTLKSETLFKQLKELNLKEDCFLSLLFSIPCLFGFGPPLHTVDF
jgi:hypothetical protein